MHQKDRLIRIMKVLQSQSAPIAAEDLARVVGAPEPLLAEDIRVLVRRKIPVHGDAERGYLLEQAREAFTLTLTLDEMEAALMGAVWAVERGDPTVATAARMVVAKLARHLPEELRPVILESERQAVAKLPTYDGRMMRQALRTRAKVRMRYRGLKGEVTSRIVWPLVIAHADEVRVLVAWCELREGFRHFTLDQIEAIDVLDARYPTRRDKLLADWREYQERTGHRANV
ncbi:helix-turn-helix transcriptional regulator [Donghicola mangrovi]|uniref:WYL domain-containing protein n=1 Tax=Donghicola mangrovi TaxID=2729614 RepID=A0A850Q602_9RHOB|nr:WYL domain-containing protein [Donghicola mangrovi]NVO21839.1 WYL domain-containing protein [Donghicola mangrovi]